MNKRQINFEESARLLKTVNTRAQGRQVYGETDEIEAAEGITYPVVVKPEQKAISDKILKNVGNNPIDLQVALLSEYLLELNEELMKPLRISLNIWKT